MMGKKDKWKTPSVEPVIGKITGNKRGLREATESDRRGWLGGLHKLELDWKGNKDRPFLPAQYRVYPWDEIQIKGGVSTPLNRRMLLHEAAHRGQEIGDQDWQEFNKLKLGWDDPSEAFADSYSDYVNGIELHPALHSFWKSRLDPNTDVGRAFGGRAKRRHGGRR